MHLTKVLQFIKMRKEKPKNTVKYEYEMIDQSKNSFTLTEGPPVDSINLNWLLLESISSGASGAQFYLQTGCWYLMHLNNYAISWFTIGS